MALPKILKKKFMFTDEAAKKYVAILDQRLAFIREEIRITINSMETLCGKRDDLDAELEEIIRFRAELLNELRERKII